MSYVELSRATSMSDIQMVQRVVFRNRDNRDRKVRHWESTPPLEVGLSRDPCGRSGSILKVRGIFPLLRYFWRVTCSPRCNTLLSKQRWIHWTRSNHHSHYSSRGIFTVMFVYARDITPLIVCFDFSERSLPQTSCIGETFAATLQECPSSIPPQ